jgi:glutathione peroxidase
MSAMRANQLSFHPLCIAALVFAAGACTNSETSTPPGGGGGGGQNQTPGATNQPKVPNTGTPDPPTNPNPVTCEGTTEEFYSFTIKPLAVTDDFKTCTLKGKAVLIVNGASDCGYTPQYDDLQALYAAHKDAGFVVVAFPSDSFNQDSKGTAYTEECAERYGVKFPLMATNPVIDDARKGTTPQPLYQWIYAQPGMSAQVTWNFEKFLVSKAGKVAKRFAPAVVPGVGSEVDLAIQAELAK